MLEFDDGEEIFKASAICKPVEGFPRNLIVTWSAKVHSAFCKRFPTSVSNVMICGPTFQVLKAESSDLDVGICLVPCGGPAVAEFIEEARCWGARRFIFIGSCGVLDRSVGDRLIVPDKALVDEGTTHHYLGDVDEVDVVGAPVVSGMLDEMGLPYVVGKTWTTDAVFRETPARMAQAKARGCICVDMECSAIASVCRFRKVECYQFFFTADRLSSEGWDKGRMGKVDGAPIYIDFALKLIEKLDESYIKTI